MSRNQNVVNKLMNAFKNCYGLAEVSLVFLAEKEINNEKCNEFYRK